jgi:hypothetical protein
MPQGAGARVTDLGIARDAEGQLEGLLDRAIREVRGELAAAESEAVGQADQNRDGWVYYASRCELWFDVI